MFDRLTPDSVTIIASYLAVIELHIGVNHHNATETTSSKSTWDADLWRTRAFLTEFGSNRHPMPWFFRTSPLRSSWTVFYYTSHLDLAVFFQLAAICRSWVKPMAQLSVRVPVINVREMPKFSYSLNTNFEWQKFTLKLSSVWIRWCRTGNQSVRLQAATSSAKPATTSSSDVQPCIKSTSYHAQRDVSVKHVCVLLLTIEVVDMLFVSCHRALGS